MEKRKDLTNRNALVNRRREEENRKTAWLLKGKTRRSCAGGRSARWKYEKKKRKRNVMRQKNGRRKRERKKTGRWDDC